MEDGSTVEEFMREYAKDPFFCKESFVENDIKFIPHSGAWEVILPNGVRKIYSAYTGHQMFGSGI